MKTLGIFGDSYAEIIGNWFPGYDTGWSYKLNKEYNGECVVHAGAGSSNPYNFRQFLEHHEKYKQIVYVVTNFHRVSIPVKATNKHTGKVSQITHFPNISHTEHVIKKYEIENDIAKKILDYMIYISYPLEQNLKDAHMASIAYIRQVRPDTIVIPAFGGLGVTSEYNWSLCDIDIHETSSWNPNRNQFNWTDPRPNHFTPKSNEWVLEHIKGRLRGEFIDWNPSLTPNFKSKKDFDAALTNFTKNKN